MISDELIPDEIITDPMVSNFIDDPVREAMIM